MKYNRLIIWAFLILGVFFRFWQFTHHQSFWKDEVGLARNFLNHDLAHIHEPFHDGQAAPIGFLQLSKIDEMIFGHTEHTFWLLPLLLGVLSLFISVSIWKNILPLAAGTIAVALMATDTTLISHVTQFKPYLTDAFVALILSGAFFYWREGGRMGAWVYLATGLLGLWLSYTSVFVLAGFGLWMIFEGLRLSRRDGLSKVARIFSINIILASVFLLLWAFNYSQIDPVGDFHHFWVKSFLPSVIDAKGLNPKFFAWISGDSSDSLGTLVGYLFGAKQWALILFLIAWGVRDAFAHNKKLLALLMPIAVTFVAAWLKIYPLYDRLELFWAPLLIPFLALGIFSLWQLASSRYRIVTFTVLLLFVALPYLHPLVDLPGTRDAQEIKQVAMVVANKAQPGEIVYVHARAHEMYKYYFKRYPLKPGVMIVSGEEADAKDLHARLQKDFSGKRVWVLFTEPFYEPSELQALYMTADSQKEIYGVADFNMAGALELNVK